jgi:alginate O-acetyltransferase complex protein AlgI
MVFSSPLFLFLFLPLVLLANGVAPRRLRNGVLLAASLFFYAWGEGFFVAVMLASMAFNHALGLVVERARGRPAARLAVGLAVAGNLALIGVYKYANFAAENLDALLALVGLGPIALAPVHLPIGISFFTFQALSYVIDVYRREAQVARNPLDVALYVALFPQLIAGPIVRYRDVAEQIARRAVTRADLAAGIRRFAVGLGKKVLIANTVALPADRIFALAPADLGPGAAWLGLVCYTLQIYFDFSGYSDMAIGLGRMLGFRFLENFAHPYVSRSLTEFWRRWHISLSTWFRDYLYIPQGGSRRGPGRTYLNLAIVFFLCGLWHGASWTFVVWGLYHGAFLVLERVGFARLLERVPGGVRHAYVILLVMIGWVFFRAETLDQAGGYLAALAGAGAGGELEHRLIDFWDARLALVLVLGIVGSAPIVPAIGRWYERRVGSAVEGAPALLDLGYALVRDLAVLLLLVASAMLLAAGTHNPFIYFRF